MEPVEGGQSFWIRTLEKGDLEQIEALQARYAECYPGVTCMPGEVYQSPGFAGGKNVFCAVEGTNKIIGVGPLLPALIECDDDPLPNKIWVDIKVDPSVQDREVLREALLDALWRRGCEIVENRPPCFTQMVFQIFPFEEEILNFLFKRGFVHTESVYRLERDLSQPIPNVLAQPGMRIQDCRMEKEEEQRQYVNARNKAFPESPITLEEWNYFRQSPYWEAGKCLGAFDGDELAGSITVFWNDSQNEAEGELVGSTEFLFVSPTWRGLGLGRYLLAQGMMYLKKHGLQKAQLEVKASNAGALGLYTKLGFQIEKESWFLVNSLY